MAYIGGADINIDINTVNTINDKLDKSGGTLTGDVSLGDNVKAKFGDSNDLQIYHNAADSYILNGTGQLILRNSSDDKDVIIQTDDG